MDGGHMHNREVRQPRDRSLVTRAALVFVAFAAIAVILLWQEHKLHFLGVLPYIFLLACPLLHVFLHGGHGHRSHRHRGDDRS